MFDKNDGQNGLGSELWVIGGTSDHLTHERASGSVQKLCVPHCGPFTLCYMLGFQQFLQHCEPVDSNLS